MSMSAVVGFFVSISALNDPDGPVAVISTFIPLTAPFVVPVRTALGAIPAWPHSRGWGYGPSGIVGVILVILLILVMMGRI